MDNLAILYSLLVTTSLFTLLWLHLGTGSTKFRVRSWSVLIQKKSAVTWDILLTFNKNHDLSLT